MKVLNLSVLLLLLLACSSLNAYTGATFIEGRELKQMCAGVDDEGHAKNTRGVGCAQFVIGVHDTMSTLTFAEEIDGGFVCFPDDYSGPQLSAIVKKYLSENGERLDEPANILVAVSFVEAYPCEE